MPSRNNLIFIDHIPHPGGLGGRRLESSHIQRFFVLFPRIIRTCALLPVHHKENTKIYQKVKAISTECLFHSDSSYFPCLLNLLNVVTPVKHNNKMLLLHIPKKCSGKTIQQLLLLFFLSLSFYRLAQALEDQMLQSVP